MTPTEDTGRPTPPMTATEMGLKVLETVRRVDLYATEYETGLRVEDVLEALREQIRRERQPFSIESGGTK